MNNEQMSLQDQINEIKMTIKKQNQMSAEWRCMVEDLLEILANGQVALRNEHVGYWQRIKQLFRKGK